MHNYSFNGTKHTVKVPDSLRPYFKISQKDDGSPDFKPIDPGTPEHALMILQTVAEVLRSLNLEKPPPWLNEPEPFAEPSIINAVVIQTPSNQVPPVEIRSTVPNLTLLLDARTRNPARIKKEMYAWFHNRRELKLPGVVKDHLWKNPEFRERVMRHLIDDILPKDVVLPELLTRMFLSNCGLSGFRGNGGYVNLLLQLGYIDENGATYMRLTHVRGYQGRKPSFEQWKNELAPASEGPAPAPVSKPF